MTDPTPSVSEALDVMDTRWPGYANAKAIIRAHIDNLQRQLAEMTALRDGWAKAAHKARDLKEAAEAALADARRDAEAKQARIDELMLEYCPDEMTQDQRDEWVRQQVAVVGTHTKTENKAASSHSVPEHPTDTTTPSSTE